jgi:hypothetical protein
MFLNIDLFKTPDDRVHEIKNPTALLLIRAAEYLKKRGHTKYVLQDDRGRVCLYGALNLGAGIPAVPYGLGVNLSLATKALGIYLTAHYPDDYGRYMFGYPAPAAAQANVSWNNADKRTQDEVVAALYGAAVIAERENII